MSLLRHQNDIKMAVTNQENQEVAARKIVFLFLKAGKKLDL